ncbi:putative odorant receptor 92a [Ostrinia nubilalis]|uniref:putative odorant receptor 92a n=1 Tax=Ostrinia nubilalis TaxID=29057 RepID=UPI00308232C1
MAEQPIDRSLRKIRFIFRYSGMNLEERSRTWLQNFIYMFNFLWILTDIVGAFNWIFEGVNKGRNFIELTIVTPCLSLGMMAEFKTGFVVAHEERLFRLINNLREMETKRLVGPSANKIVKEESKFLYALIFALIVINVVLIILFGFGPLVVIVVKYFVSGKLELTLPFLDVYPVDCYDLRIWPFAYIHQIWTTVIVLSEIFAVDFLFYICCTHIKMQFKVLNLEVTKVIAEERSARIIEDETSRNKFNELVKWHQDIIGSASMLEEIYSKSNLVNYLSSSLIICLTGFNVTAINNMTIVVTFAILCVAGMLQIFFVCFFGDMLKDSSTAVSTAVYNSRWYLADAAFGKSALIMQTRAQKPCTVTAAGFADVNLKAFMKILSSSWSYFALLQTVYRTSEN